MSLSLYTPGTASAAEVVDREIAWDRLAKAAEQERNRQWAAMQAILDACGCETKRIAEDDDEELDAWFRKQLNIHARWHGRNCATREGGLCSTLKGRQSTHFPNGEGGWPR